MSLPTLLDDLPAAEEFQPHIVRSCRGDVLEYIERDCAVVEERVANSNITLLRDVYTDQLVGVRIVGLKDLPVHEDAPNPTL